MKSYVLLIVIFFTALFSTHDASALTPKSQYWSAQQHKGANIFNKHISNDIYPAADGAHIQFVRLAPDKWPGKKRDFLIGNADDYQGLVSEDLNLLKKILSEFEKHNIKVVITMLSLPGCRWKQLNNWEDDARLWNSESYQKQAIQFWQDLAKELKNNPAVIGYNIINEPHPEVSKEFKDFNLQGFLKFSQATTNTLADLSLFYQKAVNAIRTVDPDTPIILDVGLYGDPRTFSYFKPIKGEHIIYSFHMYEPFGYTNKKQNKDRYAYPGILPINKDTMQHVDKAQLQQIYLAPVITWQKQHNIPSRQILVGEFGGNRTTKGIAQYFKDLIELFNEQNWHWAFYAFREDTWTEMDFELGSKPLPWAYWKAQEEKKPFTLKRVPNPIWNILLQGLKANPTS